MAHSRDEIRDEIIIADLDAARLADERSLANYTLGRAGRCSMANSSRNKLPDDVE